MEINHTISSSWIRLGPMLITNLISMLGVLKSLENDLMRGKIRDKFPGVKHLFSFTVFIGAIFNSFDNFDDSSIDAWREFRHVFHIFMGKTTWK
eukprot:gnl/Chilomastix_caulleri/5090.p1 GENE.gnl/Chilomastix_caulleri/5090~~gnl/Chilomastix_caulleri/5090.p1  ORF type:complete len:94 (-),score=3.11 gnl/Chilomastix_caulleri/5090:104-385(-)